jgi:hypothetical protein
LPQKKDVAFSCVVRHVPLVKFGINNLTLFLALYILGVDPTKPIDEIPAVSGANTTEVDAIVIPLAISRVYFCHCIWSSSGEV